MCGTYYKGNRADTCFAFNNSFNALRYWASAVGCQFIKVLRLAFWRRTAADYSIGDEFIIERELVKDLGVSQIENLMSIIFLKNYGLCCAVLYTSMYALITLLFSSSYIQSTFFDIWSAVHK